MSRGRKHKSNRARKQKNKANRARKRKNKSKRTSNPQARTVFEVVQVHHQLQRVSPRTAYFAADNHNSETNKMFKNLSESQTLACDDEYKGNTGQKPYITDEEFDNIINNNEQLDLSDSEIAHYAIKQEEIRNDDAQLEEPLTMRYPIGEDSTDIWVLPSGRSAYDVIRTPLSDVHNPNQFGIIRLGEGVRQPQSISHGDWVYLQRSFNLPRDSMSDKCEKVLMMFAQTDSQSDIKKYLTEARTSWQDDEQLNFFVEVMNMFINTVFVANTALRSPSANKSTLGALLIHPIFNLLMALGTRGMSIIRKYSSKASMPW
ncbi:hypothetical protein BC938DRAFT_481029 [Jimgerdemannia flammicorona]|uniref:Uncharacterized protein n=1 Tax=Jimgerdemannia flammicorona TaxID=994334 RepID=A0A433QH50_9FUNG|nr:hypothetical protein BC938DRAFT_481029 [Jimgerdemannia flammicorona]